MMRAGFTLIEFLLVIAIFLLVGVAVTPLYGNLSVTTQLNEETSQLVQTIRLARVRALAGLGGSRHGVCFEFLPETAHYILYQGASCATRLVANDRVIGLPPVLSLSTTFSNDDINFNSKGLPLATGVINLTHTTAGGRTITVNEIGLVEEE